jgi:hypothetical protein
MPAMNPPRPSQIPPQLPPRPVERRKILPVIWTAVQIFTTVAVLVLLYGNNENHQMQTPKVTLVGYLYDGEGDKPIGPGLVCTNFSTILYMKKSQTVNKLVHLREVQIMIFGCEHIELVYGLMLNTREAVPGRFCTHTLMNTLSKYPNVTFLHL